MSRKGHNRVQLKPASQQIRKGEGTPVRIQAMQNNTVVVGGVTIQGFALDLSGAPVPERKYYAELCDVSITGSVVRLMFGQPQFGSARLRSLLIVAMSSMGVQSFMEGMERMSSPSFREIVDASGIKSEPITTVKEEPVQVIELGANFALCGVSGTESCIDFFEASAFAMAQAMVSKTTLHIDSVVRVTLRTSLLLGLMEEIQRRNHEIRRT